MTFTRDDLVNYLICNVESKPLTRFCLDSFDAKDEYLPSPRTSGEFVAACTAVFEEIRRSPVALRGI